MGGSVGGNNEGEKNFFIFTFVTHASKQMNKKKPDIQNNLSRSARNSGAFQFQDMEKELGWSGRWWGGGRCSSSVLVNRVEGGLNDNGESAI